MSCLDLSKAYEIKGYPECSGHGRCLQGFCVCDIGWTGIGDMELVRGYDCDINILSVYVWSVLNVVLAGIACTTIIYFILKEGSLSDANRYRTKSHAYISALIANFSGIILFANKVVNPENVIGENIAMGLAIILLDISITYAAACYISIFVAFLKGYSRFFDNTTRDYSIQTMNASTKALKTLVCSIPFLVITSVVPVYILPPEYSEKFNIMFFATFAFGFIINGYMLLTIFSIFLKEIKKYVDSQSCEVLRAIEESNRSNKYSSVISDLYCKMSSIRNLFRFCLFVCPVGNILFATMAILRRKQTYLIQLEFSTACLCTIGAAWSLTTSIGVTPTRSGVSSPDEPNSKIINVSKPNIIVTYSNNFAQSSVLH